MLRRKPILVQLSRSKVCLVFRVREHWVQRSELSLRDSVADLVLRIDLVHWPPDLEILPGLLRLN